MKGFARFFCALGILIIVIGLFLAIPLSFHEKTVYTGGYYGGYKTEMRFSFPTFAAISGVSILISLSCFIVYVIFKWMYDMREELRSVRKLLEKKEGALPTPEKETVKDAASPGDKQL